MQVTPPHPRTTPLREAPAPKADDAWHVELIKSFWGHYGFSMSFSHYRQVDARQTEREREERERRDEQARLDRTRDRSFMTRVQEKAVEARRISRAMLEAQRFEQALKAAN